MNYCDILGVPRNATQAELETAYLRKKGLPYTDQPLYTSGQWDNTDHAFCTLHDPHLRKQHDAELDYEKMNPFSKALTNAAAFIIDGDFLDILAIRIVLLLGEAVLLLWVLITAVRYFWTHPLF